MRYEIDKGLRAVYILTRQECTCYTTFFFNTWPEPAQYLKNLPVGPCWWHTIHNDTWWHARTEKMPRIYHRLVNTFTSVESTESWHKRIFQNYVTKLWYRANLFCLGNTFTKFTTIAGIGWRFLVGQDWQLIWHAWHLKLFFGVIFSCKSFEGNVFGKTLLRVRIECTKTTRLVSLWSHKIVGNIHKLLISRTYIWGGNPQKWTPYNLVTIVTYHKKMTAYSERKWLFFTPRA